MDAIALTELPLKVAASWLEAAEPAPFAGTDAEDPYTLRIGERPVARSLRALMAAQNRELPAAAAALPGEVYLVTHAMGVSATQKAHRISQLGYTASFSELGSTIDLAPQTAFRELLTGRLEFSAALDVDGHLRAPLGVAMAPGLNDILGAGASLELNAGVGVAGKLVIKLSTPIIQAVGQSSATATWQFHRDADPLVGDQVMVQTVVVAPGVRTLTYELSAWCLVGGGLFRRPRRLALAAVTTRVALE